MRPILATKVAGNGGVFLVTPYGASELVDYGVTGFTASFFDVNTSGGPSAVQFGSKIYHMQGGTCYEYDTITGNNTSFRSLTDYSAQNHAEHHYGMFISNISGVWYLSVFYVSGASAIRVERYNFSTQTWSTSATFASAGDNQQPQRRFQFANNIYWFQGSACYKYDVAANSTSAITGFGGDHRATSMCMFNDGIYLLNVTSSTTAILYQLVGGVWQAVKTISSSLTNAATTLAPLLMSDGTNMYAILYQNLASTGWTCFQITDGLVVSDISSVIFPSYLRTSDLTLSIFKGWHVDSHIDPSDPEIWLAYTSASTTVGASLGWFRWRGPAAQMTYVGDAGEGGPDYYISYDWTGGGQYIFSPGEPNIQIEGSLSAANTAGNIDVPFKVYESDNVASGVLVDVNLYYSTSPHPPRSRARITSPTPSGLQIDDYTVRVPAGSGQLWNLEWRSAADGVQVGEQVSLTLYTSKASV
jgi:hypothetical protein